MPYADPEVRRAKQREYYQKNKDKWKGKKDGRVGRQRPYDPEAYQRNRQKRLDYQREKATGMTGEQYRAMLEEQGHACKVCRQECPTGRQLCVDHCHATGKIRGLLCNYCNVALGHVQDDPARLRALANYLEETQG